MRRPTARSADDGGAADQRAASTKGVRVGILAPNGPEFVVALPRRHEDRRSGSATQQLPATRELAWVLRDADVHTVLSVESILGKDLLDRLSAAADGLTVPLRSVATPSASQRPPAGKNFD